MKQGEEKMAEARSSTYLIGDISKKSQVSVKTIRYYEELGLIRSIDRTKGGYRLFDEETLKRLSFIRRSQKLGLALAEIKEFIDIHSRGELPCHHIQEKLQHRLSAIDQQIQHLQTMRSELVEILSDWQIPTEKSDTEICPIIDNSIES